MDGVGKSHNYFHQKHSGNRLPQRIFYQNIVGSGTAMFADALFLRVICAYVRRLKMKNWFLYMIRCKHGRLYTGVTTDVERRFVEHTRNNKKGAKCLRGKAPLALVMKKKIGSKSMALKIESRVKRLSKIKKEMLVDGKIEMKEL
jgi:putative endonuclease